MPLEPCDLMKCLNGGKCQVGLKNIPYCECPNKRYTGTQCEKDILTLNSSEADKLKSLSLQLESQISCDILGNDVTLIDYAFAAMMLFFALVIIIVMIYIYVQINIRKVKKLASEIHLENDLVDAQNQFK